ncbi:MAG: hypothetical protein FWD38_09045 [Oscillospiraceae bacterium]|nr:hypothetical protein [Oscillospiraceae bacterium]
MRPSDGFVYYLNSMALFNLIYALRVFGVDWQEGQFATPDGLFAFGLSLGLAIVGFSFSLLIYSKDHTVKHKGVKGKMVTVESCEDITGTNFFSSYALLIITGCSLPILSNFVGVILYLLILCMLGFVFVKQEMCYLNPTIVVLMRYKVVKAKCKDNNGKTTDYHFIYQKGAIVCGDEINFLNVNDKIIYLSEVNMDKINNH